MKFKLYMGWEEVLYILFHRAFFTTPCTLFVQICINNSGQTEANVNLHTCGATNVHISPRAPMLLDNTFNLHTVYYAK